MAKPDTIQDFLDEATLPLRSFLDLMENLRGKDVDASLFADLFGAVLESVQGNMEKRMDWLVEELGIGQVRVDEKWSKKSPKPKLMLIKEKAPV